MDDSAITCDEIIDADAEAKTNNEAKSNDKEKKLIKQISIKKIFFFKTQNFCFYLHFY